MAHYQATASRSDGWWAVEVHGIPNHSIFTQGRTLDDAEYMALDAVALALNVPIDSVSVTLSVAGVERTVERVARVRAARARAAATEQQTLVRAAVDLTARGITQRDIARLLGLSHQRVSQLLHAKLA